jgi:uncharacterized BrkB/YihY/UPF0761 family membrane protein
MAVFDAYGQAPGGLLANGLSFSALFAVVPITLLMVGLAGRLAEDPAVQEALADTLIRVFPPLADLIEGAVEALVAGSVAVSLIGLVGTVWTVSQFYVALDIAIARVFGLEATKQGLRRTVRGFIWVALLIALVVGYLVILSLWKVFGSLTPGQRSVVDAGVAALDSPLTLIAIAVVAVGLIYRTVPPSTPTWRALSVPAVLVGVVIIVLGQVFGLLAPWLVGVAKFVGPLAVAFVALAWLSLSFQALLIGAAWVRIRQEGAPPPAVEVPADVEAV